MDAPSAKLHVAFQHPYYPFGVDLPGYIANTIPALHLVGSFASAVAVILSATYLVAKRATPNISNGKVATTLWFVLCAFIHLFFEGYFVYHFREMPGRHDLFGQLWKEYSLSDSRYLTMDSFTVTMEAVTAIFWGPLSIVIAYCVVVDHPLRHPLQILVSLGQLYGTVLYFATSTFDEAVYDIAFCRPEMYYFYLYYILCNAFWIAIPLVLVFHSVTKTATVFAQVEAYKIAGKKDI